MWSWLFLPHTRSIAKGTRLIGYAVAPWDRSWRATAGYARSPSMKRLSSAVLHSIAFELLPSFGPRSAANNTICAPHSITTGVTGCSRFPYARLKSGCFRERREHRRFFQVVTIPTSSHGSFWGSPTLAASGALSPCAQICFLRPHFPPERNGGASLWFLESLAISFTNSCLASGRRLCDGGQLKILSFLPACS